MTDADIDSEAGAAGGYGPEHLPYGVFSPAGGDRRVGVRLGDSVLDLDACLGGALFARPSLNALMASGPEVWASTRDRIRDVVADPGRARWLTPLSEVRLHLPFEVGDYADFYSSRHHAENVGRIFRPDGAALAPNWTWLPVGYHGRSGTVVVSGTPVIRPSGQRPPAGEGPPGFGPSTRLDMEAEVGFVVGVGTEMGRPVTPAGFADHVFGVALVNDWSARDIQAWEYVPLGPFLGKSFCTSVSAWVTPLAALAAARVGLGPQEPAPLPYLSDPDPWCLDLRLEVVLDGEVVSRPPFSAMYWSPGQQLAHMTVNGASLRPGDLFASGTVSGPDRRGQAGSLLELTWNASEPLQLAGGRRRGFLEDGDTVVLRAAATGDNGSVISLGEVSGTVVPAHGR